MRSIKVVVATVVNSTAGATEAEVDTIGSRDATGGDARFFLNVTSLTGTAPTMDADIVATVDGINYVLVSFAQVSAAASESVVVATCPMVVRIVYVTGGTVTDLDFTVTCVRF